MRLDSAFPPPCSQPLSSSARLHRADDDTAAKPAAADKAADKTAEKLRPPKSPRRARSMSAASTSPTRPSPARSPWAQPTRRTRSSAGRQAAARQPACPQRTQRAQRRSPCCAHVLRGLFQERRQGRRPARHLLLQRRPGQLHRLAAHGFARPQACGHHRRPICPPRPTSWWTTPTRCSTPATWSSSICPAPALGGSPARTPEKAFWGVDEDANAFARFIAALSSPSTTAGTRPSTSLARATAPRARRFWPTSWRTARAST